MVGGDVYNKLRFQGSVVRIMSTKYSYISTYRRKIMVKQKPKISNSLYQKLKIC